MNTVAIIQARMSSSRLPGKILMELAGKPMLLNILERVSRAKKIDKIVVATSNEQTDDEVESFLKKHDYNCFRGNLNNVLDRFYHCAKKYDSNIVVRLTADNALVDPGIIDEAIDVFRKENVDYLYYKASLPLGMCIEVFSFDALEKAYSEATNLECLEHVTPYIRNNTHLFKVLNYKNAAEENHSGLRFTMDTKEDFEFVSNIYNQFSSNDFSYKDVMGVLSSHPDWVMINANVKQNTLFYNGE